MLVVVFLVLLVMLPLATTGLRQLQDLVLCQQARHYLEQTLPAAFNSLDPVSLSFGQPKYLYSNVDLMLRARFESCLPANLRGRLTLERIVFRDYPIQPDAGHWMGSNQPKYLPSITMHAILAGHQGRIFPLQFSIEFLVD